MPNQRAPGVRLRNMALHDELWQAVRDRAGADGVRLVDVVRSALAEYLGEYPQTQVGPNPLSQERIGALIHTEGGPNE